MKRVYLIGAAGWAGAAIICGGGMLFAWDFIEAQRLEQERKIAQLSTQITTLTAKRNTAQARSAQAAALSDKISQDPKIIAAPNEAAATAQVQQHVGASAAQFGVEILTISANAQEAANAPLHPIGMEALIQGPYTQIARFLASLDPHLQAQSIRLKHKRPHTEASVAWRGYWRKATP